MDMLKFYAKYDTEVMYLKYYDYSMSQVPEPLLTLVLLNPDIPCLCKQCTSRSVGF